MDTLDAKEKAAKEFEQQQRERRVAELFEIGLDDEENTAGYHGMSLETLQFLIEQGYMPGHSDEEVTEFMEPGDLFFAPILEKFPQFDKLIPIKTYKKGPDEHAAGYAQDLGQDHYRLTQLGLALDDLASRQAVMRVDSEPEYLEQLIQKSGKTKEEVRKILKDSKKRKGVVIALSKDLFTSDKLVRYGDDQADLRIQLPNGLTLKDIVGIEPQGKEEFTFLEKLQEKYS